MIPALEDIRFTADNQKPFKSVPAQPVKLTLEPLSNITRATTDEIRNGLALAVRKAFEEGVARIEETHCGEPPARLVESGVRGRGLHAGCSVTAVISRRTHVLTVIGRPSRKGFLAGKSSQNTSGRGQNRNRLYRQSSVRRCFHPRAVQSHRLLKRKEERHAFALFYKLPRCEIVGGLAPNDPVR